MAALHLNDGFVKYINIISDNFKVKFEHAHSLRLACLLWRTRFLLAIKLNPLTLFLDSRRSLIASDLGSV
ncbi:MAG: hypothetical protein EBY21_13345 [Alphaproteobacteria bacterium]|nr:hypothetical protein [Alphaproteobacteria bacterium]